MSNAKPPPEASPRVLHVDAVQNGYASASYQTFPATERPFKVRGVAVSPSGKTRTYVEIAYTREQIEKVIADLQSFAGIHRGQS